MMPLSHLGVKHAGVGRHADEKGLYLLVKPSGTKSWVLRVQVNGRRRDFGLGSADLVSLGEARSRAAEWRKMAKLGLDPALEARRAIHGVPTFKDAADRYIKAVQEGWKNEKHALQWTATLTTYAHPKIGGKTVDQIDVAAIHSVLLPIWMTIPETARRVRQRIGAVLDYAHAQGWRDGEAPMRAVAKGLPKQPRKDGHFAAMPYSEVPALMKKLGRADLTIGRLALQFAILTAGRSGEVRGAGWGEIDLDDKTWTVPASRMKAGVAHVVPLSDAAIAILKKANAFRGLTRDGVIFPGLKGKPLSDMTLTRALELSGGSQFTVHGFRSSFRDWVAEKMTAVPSAVAEAALAHTVPNKVEAAYRRTKFLDLRRSLMAEWAKFLAPRK